jgi:predicted DNA-binding antitoxin AbrB/MazE fold protein
MKPLYKVEFSEGIIYQIKYVWMNILIIGRHIKKKAT